MNDEPILDALVQVLLFLELSDNETLNEDAAIAVMEQIAMTLQRMDAPARDRFLQYLRYRAEQTAHEPERQTIATLANSLGLTPQ